MKFKTFYESWWYLNESPVFDFNPTALEGHELNYFHHSLCIEVVKVNPKNNTIEDDESLNTKVQVWLEAGEPFEFKEGDLGVQCYHNINYDSGGDTFEEAIDNLKEAVALYMENAKELGLMEDIQESLSTKEKYTARLEMVV